MRNGEIYTYDSQTDAARAMNINSSTMNNLMVRGVYGCTKKRPNEWLWKVERVLEEKPKLSSVEERKITVEGFTHLTACSNGEILNEKRKSLGSPGWQYLRVTVPWMGKNISKAAHILIASTFIPNPENKPYVNHIDGQKSNNAVSNLEWVTQKENIQHAFRTGLIKEVIVPVYQLELDGSIIKKFDSVKEAGIFAGSQQVSKVCSSYLLGKTVSKSNYGTFSGYGWCYVKDYTTPVVNKTFFKIFPELVNRKDIDYYKIRKYVDSKSRPFWQIDIDGTRIKFWESYQEVEKELSSTISVNYIYKSLRSGNKLAGSYIWQNASYEDIVNPSSNYIKRIPEIIRIALDINDENTQLKPEAVKLLRNNIRIKSDGRIKNMPIVQLSLDDKIVKYWAISEIVRVKVGYKYNQIQPILDTNQELNGYKWRKMTIREMCE